MGNVMVRRRTLARRLQEGGEVVKLRAGRELSTFGGYGVDRKLTSMISNAWVFWGERGNSYVVVDRSVLPELRAETDPEHDYKIYSINGIGEVRWTVEQWNRDAESNAAREYFFEEV